MIRNLLPEEDVLDDPTTTTKRIPRFPVTSGFAANRRPR